MCRLYVNFFYLARRVRQGTSGQSNFLLIEFVNIILSRNGTELAVRCMEWFLHIFTCVVEHSRKETEGYVVLMVNIYILPLLLLCNYLLYIRWWSFRLFTMMHHRHREAQHHRPVICMSSDTLLIRRPLSMLSCMVRRVSTTIAGGFLLKYTIWY